MLFDVAGTAGTSLTMDVNRSFSNAGGAIVFSANAPAYTISGAGVLTFSTGAIVNNGSAVQTINNGLHRNTSNPITIGANGGSLILNGNVNMANGTVGAAFGTSTGGSIYFNGSLTNSVGTGNFTVSNATSPGYGTVVLAGNNSGFTSSSFLTLGGNTMTKLSNAAAVATDMTVRTGTTSGLGNNGLWLASDTAINSFKLDFTSGTAAQGHTVMVGSDGGSAVTNQNLTSLTITQQQGINFIKAGNVASGTPKITVTGETQIARSATSTGRTSIIAANGVDIELQGGVNLGGTTTVNQFLTLDGSSTNSLVSSVITNGGGVGGILSIGKAGTGTWTFTKANTYTGATAVNNGVLQLDFNAAGAASSDILYNGVADGQVSLGGGNLWLAGKDGTASSQALGAFVTAGNTGGSAVTLRAGTGGGASMNVTVTGLTVNTASTINFDLGAGTNFRNTSIVAAAFVNQGAFYNNNYARYDASGNVLEAVNANFSTGASVLANNGGSTSSYFFLNGAQTRSAGLSFKGLRIDNTADSQTLDLGGTTQIFSNSSILYRGGNNSNYTIGNGTLSGGTSNLIFQVVSNATLNVSGDVNMGGGLAATFTKSGEGSLVISGAKNFTGRWNVTEGVLSIDSIANGGTNSGLGASTNVAGNLFLYGGTLKYTGGTASTDRSFTVGGRGAVIDASGSGALNWAPGAALAFVNSRNNNNAVTATDSAQNQSITFTGTSVADNTFGSASALLTDTGPGRLTVIKSGAGKWILNQANTYTGGTQITGGTLGITNASALGTYGVVSFGGGTLQYGSGITTDLSYRIQNSTGAISIDTNGNNVAFQSRLDETNVGGLTKSGSGTLTLANSNIYTGTTTVNGGSLVLGAGGIMSGNGNLTINTGATFALKSTASLALGTSAITFGGGTFDIDAGGAVDLNNAFSGNGTIRVLSGSLNVAGNTSAFEGDISIADGLTFTGSGAADFSGVTFDLGGATSTLDFSALSSITIFNITGTGALIGNSIIIDDPNFNASNFDTSGVTNLVVVPEPHEYAFMMAGLLGVIIVIRRMRRNAVTA